MNQPNPFDSGYYNEQELSRFGFKSVGDNVRIAKNCTIVGLENITLADNVRIDSYVSILAHEAGWLDIGSHVHIGAGCYLSAGDGIVLRDFSGLSQGVHLYSRSDDYSGEHLTNPTVPVEFTGVTRGTVTLERHAIVGSGSVALPGVTLREGTAVGALSLVTKSTRPWGVYFGRPAKRLKNRSKKLLELEKQMDRAVHRQPIGVDRAA